MKTISDNVTDSAWYCVWNSVSKFLYDKLSDKFNVSGSAWNYVYKSVRNPVRDSVGKSLNLFVRKKSKELMNENNQTKCNKFCS